MNVAPSSVTTRSRRSVAIALVCCASLLATSCAAAGEASPTAGDPATAADTSSSQLVDTAYRDGEVYVFDDSVVHEIGVSFEDDDYAGMLETYATTGEKDWVEAAVTIDGIAYEQAAIRLKGNSSLRGLAGGGRNGRTDGLSTSAPEDLPWLIRLDKYVEGQNHQGVTNLVVRSNNSATSLNEAVALELLDLAGLASQQAITAGFSVNGSNAVLRLVIELPDDAWMEATFDDPGALYKAESTGDYSYRGTDPDSYDEVFDQEAGEDNVDLTPLIGFLDFVNNADGATFNARLDDRLDVDSFATYLAMQDLIDNFDDIDGPGNNSYLYYDITTGMFTVVPWDFNLAFGVVNGGGGAPGDGGFAGGPARGGPAGDGGPAGAPGGGSNVLVERFLANSEWNDLYEANIEELTANLYDSGAAADVLARWVDLLQTDASDLIDPATVAEEAAQISEHF